MSSYHLPVMLKESIDSLVIDSNGVYVDLTHGGGGHSKEILSRLTTEGRLIAFDQDQDAEVQVVGDDKLVFCRSNFEYFGQWLKYLNIEKVDGVFADLGVSSWQIDDVGRGFAWRFDEGELDMRMSVESKETASDLLMRIEYADLVRILSAYGEVRNAKTLASAICERREDWTGAVSVAEFNGLLSRYAKGDRRKYFSQVYQALRIAVNREMDVLETMLMQVAGVLKQGGRFSVLTYHSLEDKLVKRYMSSGRVDGKVQRDDYGRSLSPFKFIGKKYSVPSDEEIELNSRARSAKLRVVEKI